MSDSEYLPVKAEIFRIIRAASDTKSPKTIHNSIKDRLPGIDRSLINRAIAELYEQSIQR